MTLLQAKGLVKQYGHVRALDGADFDAQRVGHGQIIKRPAELRPQGMQLRRNPEARRRNEQRHQREQDDAHDARFGLRRLLRPVTITRGNAL